MSLKPSQAINNRKPGREQGASGLGPSYSPLAQGFTYVNLMFQHIGFECDFTTYFRWQLWNRLHTLFWEIHSVLSQGGKKKKDKLEGEDVVSLGRLVRLPACTPLQ